MDELAPNNNSSETENFEQKSQQCRKYETKEIKETNAQIQILQNKIAKTEKERDDFKEECDKLKDDSDIYKTKYTTLTSKLREHLECPVCLEVPTAGPVYCCPNGHFVCFICKDVNCPTCRGRMFSNKSLLATTVIENIEHTCRNEDCQELFPLPEYFIHLNCCPHRVVNCPAPTAYCDMKMPLSKVYNHVLGECEGSLNKDKNNVWNNGKFPKTMIIFNSNGLLPMQKSSQGLALDWEGTKFYVNYENDHNYKVFSVQLLGNVADCKDYEVSITVHKSGDHERNGKNVQRLVCEPLPVDIDEETRKKNGMLVGPIVFENMVNFKKNRSEIAITVDFKK